MVRGGGWYPKVDYGTFMTMTEEKNIGRVDIESNQIIFTDKDETQVYKTGLMNDTGLTERLYDAEPPSPARSWNSPRRC